MIVCVCVCVCERTLPSKKSLLLTTFNNAVLPCHHIHTSILSNGHGVFRSGGDGGGRFKQPELESYHAVKFHLRSAVSIQALVLGVLKYP